jgi:hypothetical protein
MICLIDGFKYLSNASFLGITSFVDRESSLYQNADGIIEHSQRLTHNNLTCRIYRTSDDRVSYHWWIDEHVSQTHMIKLFSVFFSHLVVDTFSRKVSVIKAMILLGSI